MRPNHTCFRCTCDWAVSGCIIAFTAELLAKAPSIIENFSSCTTPIVLKLFGITHARTAVCWLYGPSSLQQAATKLPFCCSKLEDQCTCAGTCLPAIFVGAKTGLRSYAGAATQMQRDRVSSQGRQGDWQRSGEGEARSAAPFAWKLYPSRVPLESHQHACTASRLGKLAAEPRHLLLVACWVSLDAHAGMPALVAQEDANQRRPQYVAVQRMAEGSLTEQRICHDTWHLDRLLPAVAGESSPSRMP
jgi:hypothetical protein